MKLTEKFPHAVRINGEVYELNTDFRVGLKIMQAFEDPRLATLEKKVIMCDLLFQNVPKDLNAATIAAIKFLDCGKPRREANSGRVYSFSKDSEYIYSAFLQTFGVDLQTAEMHWWKFCAMFGDLGQETTFNQIVGLRSRKQRGKLSKEDREIWFRMHDVLTLEEETEADPELQSARDNFDRLMGGG